MFTVLWCERSGVREGERHDIDRVFVPRFGEAIRWDHERSRVTTETQEHGSRTSDRLFLSACPPPSALYVDL
ncbi:hypothetical protein ANANG_G00129730 [Anguilla anguilla]|uniref:Uncharacterized protein n=1 Tax=Anguilla anguilla TaxID=7936 RepID=A0A9D3RYC8_ANGAN|nr:hypothetical protein ANANG_G00129730 [Anguilla anguilla]